MTDQVAETQDAFETESYPSQDNPKEIVPWLNKAAEKMAYYESIVKRLKGDDADIQKAKPFATMDRLIWRLLLHLFCGAAIAALVMGLAYCILAAFYYVFSPKLFLFPLFTDHWQVIGYVTYGVVYLILAYREIAQRKKLKRLISEQEKDINDCANILSSDKCLAFYSYILPYIGPSYRYSFAANYFVKLFLDGRCSTLPDAKNLYEQDKNALEQRQQFLTLLDEVGEAKSMAGAAMSRANSALAASAFATATALSASSRASAAESSLEDIKRSL